MRGALERTGRAVGLSPSVAIFNRFARRLAGRAVGGVVVLCVGACSQAATVPLPDIARDQAAPTPVERMAEKLVEMETLTRKAASHVDEAVAVIKAAR